MQNKNSIVKDGKVIRTSENLRGMRDYARVSPVAHVKTLRDLTNKSRGYVVEYDDGATCCASFASFHIMIDFVRARRSWRRANITHVDGDIGYLTKPGIIAGV